MHHPIRVHRHGGVTYSVVELTQCSFAHRRDVVHLRSKVKKPYTRPNVSLHLRTDDGEIRVERKFGISGMAHQTAVSLQNERHLLFAGSLGDRFADHEAVHCNCCHHKHQGSKADGKDFSFHWFILFVLLS